MRLRLTSQNRVRLSDFAHTELLCLRKGRWLVYGDLTSSPAGRGTLMLEKTFDETKGYVLGEDQTILIPNGIDLLHVTENCTCKSIVVQGHMMVFNVFLRQPIDPEQLAYYRLPADKTMTDPKQIHLFDELSPPKRKKP